MGLTVSNDMNSDAKRLCCLVTRLEAVGSDDARLLAVFGLTETCAVLGRWVAPCLRLKQDFRYGRAHLGGHWIQWPNLASRSIG
jgi:hypothetical protein